MPLITCLDCSHQISDQAPACPSCGRPTITPAQKAALERKQRREEANVYNYASWLLFLLAILFGIAGLLWVAGLFFVIALVVSVIYHVKR